MKLEKARLPKARAQYIWPFGGGVVPPSLEFFQKAFLGDN